MELTENQEMYLKILDEFIEQEVEPRLKELDTVDEYPFWMQQRMAELGFTRLVAPEEYGGLGENMTTLLLLIMRACQYNNTLGSLLNCSNNANKLLSFANEQQIETFFAAHRRRRQVHGYGLYRAFRRFRLACGSDDRGA